jgi:hypothetical protein
MPAGQAIEPLDRRMQQLGVGREGDGLGLYRGIDRDPLEVVGVNAVSIFLTCAEVKFSRRRVTVISRRCDQGLHFCVDARGGAAAVPGSAS